MFAFAILIGIYSHIIFSLGLLGFLYKQSVIVFTILYLILIFSFYKNILKKYIEIVRGFSKKINLSDLRKYKLIASIVLLITLQGATNLPGVLGPELGFDALWYHLTLPKLYLINHNIVHFPGGLLYYSDMPKLVEMLYVGALSIGNEITAKFVHFLFGIASLFALYKLSRKFFNVMLSLIVVLIFYSNLVVLWQSTTAYIDLVRTFFEIMALYGFVNWWENREERWLIESSAMLGLAISTKLLAVGSLFIFTALIILSFFQDNKRNSKLMLPNILTYWVIALLIPLPWFIFSFINTGNFVYPFFTNLYKIGFDFSLFNPLNFVSDFWNVFTRSSDPISPIYIILFPLIIFLFKSFNKFLKLIAFYSFFAFLVWYIEPRTGGGRFIVPYLPAFSVLSAGVIDIILKRKDKLNRFFANFCIGMILLIGILSVIYRGAANAKYVPVILGIETKNIFLEKHLNFSFGDFYDTDGFFKKNIKKEDIVLLYGFHNLYYVDFPFIDSSWVKRGDTFNYIAVQNNQIPERFKYWNLVYYNPKTNVKLYSIGGDTWVY